MKSVALIPARGGSKRLPRKNIHPFFGKPLMAHTIEAALQSDLFERVVVSTEDDEIAKAAQKFGAQIHKRSPDLATDKAMVGAVTQRFLNDEKTAGREYDVICVLYATAALRGAEDIRKVHDLIAPGACTHALAVTEYSHAAHQALKKLDGNDLAPMWPEIVAARADSLPPLVVDNGSTYCVLTKSFMQTPKFYSEHMRGHVMPRWQSVDIDTLEDLELAEFYARKHGVFP